MSAISKKSFLYLVVLGGQAKTSNIELHDIRWVAGDSIESTIPILCKQWFGEQKGLHIDSYKKIEFIDGFKIIVGPKNIEEIPYNLKDSNQIYDKRKKLWFVNLGGYNPEKLSEFHEISLHVSETSKEAEIAAKKQWKANLDLVHKDQIENVTTTPNPDNCSSIERLGKLFIHLSPDTLNRNQKLNPDWYGYWRIDK